MTPTSITVQWNTVPCLEQNGDITGYTLRVLESGEVESGVMERVVDVVGDDVSQVTISGLTQLSTYSIKVAAVNGISTGPYSDSITINTPDSEYNYYI